MSNNDERTNSSNRPPSDRRKFLSLVSTSAMTTGLVASYGTLAYMGGRFLYSGEPTELAWLYVAPAGNLRVGDAIPFQSPGGQKVTVTRRGNQGNADDFLALSSTCPHLGCQVHWESQNNRFFCPCHNGVFDSNGVATAGPPADAHQSLPHYAIKVENGMIFIQAPVSVVGTRT